MHYRWRHGVGRGVIERRSIDLPGWSHAAPVPLGCRVGNMVFSSRISGRDPATGALPAEPTEQARLLFANLAAFMAAAGGTTQHIGHVTVLLSDPAYRSAFDEAWLGAFPDPASRPARHVREGPLRGGVCFQVEVIAVL
jgi:2-iminobutanoate/2-iminopropanoate deaminase